MLAHDTRASARELVAAAAAGVAALGGVAVPCGLLTTPQLHWMVRQANAAAKHDEAAYFGALAAGFAALVSRAPAPAEVSPPAPTFNGRLVSHKRRHSNGQSAMCIGVHLTGLEMCFTLETPAITAWAPRVWAPCRQWWWTAPTASAAPSCARWRSAWARGCGWTRATPAAT